MALQAILALMAQRNERKQEVPVAETANCPPLFTREESGDIEFIYSEPFDRNTGEYDQFYGRFSRDAYEKGKQELAKTDSCRLQGYHCELEIRKVNDSFMLSFHSQNKEITLTRGNLEGFFE
jgi:hypothetical protein